jgi:hypothetical protein
LQGSILHPESAMHTVSFRSFRQAVAWLGALLVSCIALAAFAQEAADPPARVAHLSVREGSVVFAPQGEDEWTELPRNRPITSGDRLWTDRDARAELQLGAATVQIAPESHLGVIDLDERAAHFVLQQGSVNARVRELTQGENFEVSTPNLALRAQQPGDYRIDVDPASGQTQVTVHSGHAQVFGEGGQAVDLGAGQQAAFAGRFLAPVQVAGGGQDAFGQWAAERNRLEDASIAARHVPRGVVGYAELDPYGQWGQDANYGAVWYPQLTVQDWAPYRYGHWAWIHPWGWTWIDDAPWGFAPFHYGRWTMIGNRWAWVPGRMAVRPVYSPALVVFVGDGVQLSIGSAPAVGWYPLAPGEAWYPVYRASPRYLGFANFIINLGAYPRNYGNHVWRQRSFATTAVPVEDFRRGRPVYRHWQPLQPQAIGQARIGAVPQRPDGRVRSESYQAPRLQAAPPQQQALPQRFYGGRESAPAVREQYRAQQDQQRLQRDAERAAREQIRQQEFTRQQQDVREQREQLLRQQQEQAGRIEAQRMQAQRQEEQAQRQQEQAARQQEHFQRQQQERAQREAWQRQREQDRVRVLPQQVQQAQPQQQVQPVLQQQQVQPVGRGQREEREDSRGGNGHGRWNRDGR